MNFEQNVYLRVLVKKPKSSDTSKSLIALFKIQHDELHLET
jgi:hypothetical protein